MTKRVTPATPCTDNRILAPGRKVRIYHALRRTVRRIRMMSARLSGLSRAMEGILGGKGVSAESEMWGVAGVVIRRSKTCHLNALV